MISHFWSFQERENGTKKKSEEDQLTNERGYKVVPLYVQDYVLICLLLQLESIYLQLRIKSLVL